ncbi:MAG: DegV family protein, partial [Clostridiales bacterium]
MNKKIALLIDSCTDVPQEYIDRYGIFVIPLMIHYSYGEFRDGIDINPQQVYDRFSEEIPTTSLPSGDSILKTLQEIYDLGFDQVVAVTISSGLSGTNNVLTLMAKDFGKLDCRIIDTKSIGIGAGVTAIYAAQLIQDGLDIDAIEEKLHKSVANSKIFFCVSTLEYLKKGGRIGLVSATMGNLLGILPVISCNEEGIYYTVKKARGRQSALKTALNLTVQAVGNSKKYNIAIVHGNA